MALYIETIILHNRAPFEHLELSLKPQDVVLLTSYSGGGKTTILSHIVDALFELARPHYQNEFEDKQNKFYRVSSNLYNLVDSKPSFVYIRFRLSRDGVDDEVLDYLDVRGNPSQEDYDEAINLTDKIPYRSFANALANSPCVKLFSRELGQRKTQSLFDSNVLTYFPSYRFEHPGYLNDPYRNEIAFTRQASYSGYLPNPLEVVTDLPSFTNWMMDVLVDWQVYKVESKNETDAGTFLIDSTPEKTNVWDVLNRIIDLCIEHEEGRLRLGIGKRTSPGQRISIMCDIDSRTHVQKYPSIFNLSAGEMAAITLFGEILRQADSINRASDVPGIVLIDEIDIHQHIRIQREVLPKLIRLFPNLQFIISSHSPFVAMGLSEMNQNRFSLIHLGNKTGIEMTATNDPLYEEVYELMIGENENYKRRLELIKNDTSRRQLIVEDRYDQIYKIAWLKLMGEPFSEDTLEQVFEEKSPFKILNNFAATGVAGCLSVRNSSLFSDRIIIGLFDFDKEGSERFYCLAQGFQKDDIKGDLISGFYKEKNTKSTAKMYGLILPVPCRLHHLIAEAKTSKIWHGSGCFSNFVEIETLLSEHFKETSQAFVKNNLFGHDYYAVRDDKKSVLWKDLIDAPKETFLDFVPLFKRVYELFELDSSLWVTCE